MISRITILAALLFAHVASADAVPGGIYQFTLPEGASGAVYDEREVFVRDGVAYVGIGIKTKVGTKTVQLTGADNLPPHKFEVVDKQYPEQRLTIKGDKMVNPDPETLPRIRAETARMLAAYRQFTDGEVPSEFRQPVVGIVSSPFGHRRILNGQPRNPHSGLDIAADTGTPVGSAAPGVVAVTGDFYFNGNTVIVDHGRGLVTMYCHLHAIHVEEGDVVDVGAELGLVGSTGRSTGPHLHWSVSMNGYRVDPVLAMEMLNEPPAAITAAAGED